MKLLLKEDVEGLGHCGDAVTVKDGYGRNYLIPQGKALLATPRNVKQFNHQKSIVQTRLKKVVDSAEARAGEISKITCTVVKKIGEQGKLYGSVTSQEIADLLKAKGVEIDKRKIQMKEPIKSLGDFKVPIKLHHEVTAEINVTVVAHQEPGKEPEAAPESAAPALEPAAPALEPEKTETPPEGS